MAKSEYTHPAAWLKISEHDQRTANKTARLISNAKSRYSASMEELVFDASQGRDKGKLMQLARIEFKAAKFFDKMADMDLLIIDDFGMKILDGQQLLDFMELIEDRHGRKSTIISSQLPLKNWYEILAKNSTIADAVIDRLVKSSHRIDIFGENRRK